MKNFKKLTILLLSLVMAFSCLAVFAFAANDEDAKIAQIGALIEYYNEEGIYVCDAFDGASAGGALTFAEESAGEYATMGGKTVYSATLDGKNVLFSPEIQVSDDAKNVAVVYSFCVTAGAGADKGYLALEFSGSSQTVDSTDAQSVLVFDYNEGKAYFAAMDAGNILSSQEIAGLVPESGAWYTLSMIYNVSANTFKGEVEKEGGEAFGFEYYLEGIASLTTLQLRSRNLGNAGVTVAWDTLEVYEGSFIRSNLAGERQKALDAKLLAYMQEYETASDAVKAAIVKAVDDLLALGYVPAPGSETETFFNEEFKAELVDYHWATFAEKVSAFDASMKFDARYAALVDAKAIDAAFPARPAGVSEAFYNEIVSAYTAEAEALAVIEQYAKVLIGMVSFDVEHCDYASLLGWLLNFEEARESLLRQDGSYDDTYFGLPYAIDIYEAALDRFASMKKSALDFIAAVDAMQNVAGANFGDMFTAYNTALEIMSSAEFANIRDYYFADLTFTEDGEYVIYDGRACKIESVAADGKSAVITINYMPYTATLSNYTLILEGEGMRIVFETLDGSGTDLEGSWQVADTVLGACDLFELRRGHIETGSAACKSLISEISTALLAKGYDVRVEKRDGVLALFADIRYKFEEKGIYYGYAGVAEALASFDAFCARIDADKANADAFIALVQELKTATTYAEIKALIEELEPLSVVGNVEGYKNEISTVIEANDIYIVNKAIVDEAEGNARIFIGKVNEAVAADDLPTRLAKLREAQKLFGKLEDAATGVTEAKETFAAEKASYLADAAAMNESAKEQGEKLVGIALSNVKFAAPQKLVFIVKKVYEL